MHHSRLTETAENLKKEFEQIFQENISLKMHIKDLEEKCNYYASEISKAHSFIHELQAQLASLRRCTESEVKERRVRRLKLGADWFMEGDYVVDAGLFWSVGFDSPVLCVEVAGDIVVVGCANNLFVIIKEKKRMFRLEETGNEFVEINLVNNFVCNNPEQSIIPKNDIHNQPILIKFSDCHEYLYTVTPDLVIRKWNTRTLDLLWKFENQSDRVIDISVVGDHLFYCTDLFVIKSFDDEGMAAYDSKNITNYPRDKLVATCLEMSKDTKYAFCGTNDRKIVMFNLETGTYKENVVHTKVIKTLDISSDGEFLITGGLMDTINVYCIDYDNMKIESIYGPLIHLGEVNIVRFLPEPEYVISGGNDHSIRIWDLENKKSIRISAHPHGVSSLGVGDGFFCSGGFDKRLRIWEYKIVDSK
ncbi:Guanine nucleotide-binding protein subunit beta-like protein [Astathelohania contejeani]|uniref:Guanine nucleotide-binding protein subunit beta-like protein n=1 Tax=Astathelohania contejeani TaxID=164912 RepID=A0ABQ7HWU2_9MICR|nr:Guanine nucleotide-binding protein subunit beta-like protein [Thelohania contejeani]